MPTQMSESGSDQDTVLIVEDEPSLAELFSHRLEDDYDTTIANHAGDAIAHIDAETDYVFLDRKLPGMSGDKVLEYIVENSFDANVIIVSAISPDQNVIHDVYDEYLVKSVDEGELRDAINRVDMKNRLIELLGKFVRKAETWEAVSSQLNTPESDANVDLAMIEDDLDELAAEFATLSANLSDSKVTDILCELDMDEFDC